ncbi:MAG: DUF1013 domain-containing protein, partial [Rhizobiales bacterium]|nr:DUF1013 domain-containing protein [Hyphomicrobiales bacterium]
DAAIMRLVGTTKPTIDSIRTRSHWNSTNLAPMDPVTLGLCSQIDLDFEVEKAGRGLPQSEPHVEGETLLSAEDTTAADALAAAALRSYRPEAPKEDELDADAVFAKLKSLKGPVDDEDDEGV